MILNSENFEGDSPFTGRADDPDISLRPEPMFWGTGELLTWDAKKLLLATGNNRWFDSAFDEGCIDARGFYGYFPVITEKESIVVIDPSDFHSELFTLRLNSPSLVSRFIEFGDVIAFGAVTMGHSFQQRIDTMKRAESDGSATVEMGAMTLLKALEEKLTGELRRGLGIAGNDGIARSVNDIVANREVVSPLLEMMAVEERLGITLDGNGDLKPRYSSVMIFFHQHNDEVA